MEIVYTFSALATVPCRFNLRRYPFGTQICNICFWAENAFRYSKYELSFGSSFAKSHNKTMTYKGRKDLGEYFLLDLTHSVGPDPRMAILNIRMQTLFGFHLLNSFTPSIMIFLISYSTLFFSLDDFNERVMVSLTSLLVLATLFTQASSTAVRTPYFKFLDIWYVALISFTFLIVITNIGIHRRKVLERESRNDSSKRRRKSLNDGYSSATYQVVTRSSAMKYNFVARFVFAGVFLAFVFFYSLGASEII